MNFFTNNLNNIYKLFLFVLILSLSLSSLWFLHGVRFNILEFKNFVISLSFFISIPLLLIKNNSIEKQGISWSKLTLISLFVYSTLSIIWIGHDYNDFLFFLRKWLLYFYAFLVIYIFLKHFNYELHFDFLIRLLLLSSLTLCLIYFSIKYFDMPSAKILPRIEAGHNGVTFGNKNGLLQYLLMIFPLYFYNFLGNKKYLEKLFTFFGIGATLAVVMMIRSNIGIIVIFSELLLIMFIFYKHRGIETIYSSKKLFISIALLLTLTAIFIYSIDITVQNFNFFSDVYNRIISEDTVRKNLWMNMILGINSSFIFGHGLGSLVPVLQSIGESISIQKGHNDLLELILELGIIGLVFILIFSYFFTKDFLSIETKSLTLNPSFVLVGVIGTLILSMTTWPLQHYATTILFSIFLSLILIKAQNKLAFKNYFDFKILKLFLKFIAILIIVLSPIEQFKWLKNYDLVLKIIDSSDGRSINPEKAYEFTDSPLLITHLNHQRSYDSVKTLSKAQQDSILSLAIKVDSDNAFAYWKKIKLATREKDLQKSELLFKKMQEIVGESPVTFDAGMSVAFLKKDANLAAKIYDKYKKIIYKQSELLFKDYRYFVFLFEWSARTKNYNDLIFSYDVLFSMREKQVGNELIMADYYFVTKQYEKSIPHIKFILNKDKSAIKKEVVDFLKEKGFL